MTARITWARRGGEGPVISRGLPRPPAACNECATGGGLSLTVFIPGYGDKVVDGLYAYDEESEQQMQDFLDRLGGSIADGVPRGLRREHYECCYQLVLRAALDPERTVRQNGRDIGSLTYSWIGAVVRNGDWVKSVNVHTIGFSAGGLVAVEAAGDLSRRVVEANGACKWRRGAGAMWCGNLMPTELPVEIDVVTIATPYKSAGSIAEFFADLGMAISGGSPAPFFTSVGALDFGGGQRPQCVCGYIAILSGDQDTEAGEQYPGDEVDDWQPSIQILPDATHMGALGAALDRPDLKQYLHPGCHCF